MDVRIESAGLKIAGVFFLVLSVILAIEVIWAYGLDILFWLSYGVWIIGFALGAVLVAIGILNYQPGREVIDIDKFESCLGKCKRCGMVGQIYYPRGLNNPSLHRCKRHLDTLIL